MNSNKQICKRCIYDSDVPSIEFNNDGICNYCKMIDDLKEEYGTGNKKELNTLRKFFKK